MYLYINLSQAAYVYNANFVKGIVFVVLKKRAFYQYHYTAMYYTNIYGL